MTLLRCAALLALLAAACPAADRRDEDFSRYSPTRPLADTWHPASGSWRVDAGRLVGEGRHSSFCVWLEASDATDQEAAADVVMLEPYSPDSWFAAGVAVYWDRRHFWRAALVASPKGRRYFELVEMHAGCWQAQSHAGTALKQLVSDRAGWDYGKRYRIRLRLTSDRVRADLADAEGRTLGTVAYALGKTPAVRRGRVALNVASGSAAFDHVHVTAQPTAGATGKPIVEPGPNGIVAVVRDPGDPPVGVGLARKLRKAGYAVTSCDRAALCEPDFWTGSGVNVLVLPDCRSFPAPALAGLDTYLRRAGKLVLVGGRPFERLLWRAGGQWLDPDQVAARRNATRVQTLRHDFEAPSVGAWTRSTNNPDAPSRVASDTPGAAGTDRCVRFDVKDMKNWDTFAAPQPRQYFEPGHTLTCFWARGGPRTTQMAVEWKETDGSRWIATVPLAEQWRYVVLPPEAFGYWRDSRSTGRGGPSDRLNTQNAATLTFGLAMSHCRIDPGDHVFWVDQIGTAPDPIGERPAAAAPVLEAVSPYYKTYPLASCASVRATAAGRRLGLGDWPGRPTRVHSPIPRPTGQGFGKGRPARWIPLAQCLDSDGVVRGAPASLVWHGAGLERGAGWLFVGQAAPDVRAEPFVTDLIVSVARRWALGLGLAEAGAESFCCYPGEPVALGARVHNFSKADADVTVALAVTASDGKRVFERSTRQTVAPGRVQPTLAEWRPGPDAVGLYRVTTQLLQGGAVLDEIAHELRITAPTRPAPEALVRVNGDHFELGGRRWYPFGINFWPTYVAGCETLAWLEPKYYQPDVVERDLALCREMGMNMLSIQAGSPATVRNLRDFVERAYAHGLRLHVFLHGADPLRYSHKTVRQTIEGARLAETPAVFAYDIAWEHKLDRYGARRRWDGHWARWIDERYGGLAAAERDWRFKAPRADGRVTGPSDVQVTRDGPWRVMAAAYRRFVDDLVSRHYRIAVRRIRTLDPHHLIGVRSGYGGTGPCHPSRFPLDVKSGIKHLDFSSPEGWGMSGGWQTLRDSGLTTAYCRFVGAGKPVFWCEYGMTVWDRSAKRPDATGIVEQGGHYERFVRMLMESGADGSSPWYLPGWYRVNEKSDYGIVGPDFTLRPAALALKRASTAFRSPRSTPEPNAFVTIDRDAHPAGFHHVYYAHKKAYGDLRRQGKTPGVRTAATGSTSATCPLVAVGGTPCSGSNPPKHLNAEFNRVDVKGRTVTVSVGNLEEATWLAPEDSSTEGGVWLLVGDGQRVPLPRNTAYHQDAVIGPFTARATGKLRIQLGARRAGRDVRFGEIAHVDLAP